MLAELAASGQRPDRPCRNWQDDAAQDPRESARDRRRGVSPCCPTGKARVRMQMATGAEAQTLAQFLVPRSGTTRRQGLLRSSVRTRSTARRR